MLPPLSGPAASDLPLIIFSQTRSGSGPLVSQPPRGPHTARGSHPQSRTTSERGIQITEPPKPKCISPDLFLPSPAELQKPPRTLRSRRAVKHRASVDVTSEMDWVTSLDGVGPKQVTPSSGRSMWTHKRERASVDYGVWGREARFGSVKPLSDPLPEKQRVINVRRAKKMQQVFGSELPHTLFQVTHVPPVPELENDTVDGFDDRASVSTIFSASTINLQSPNTSGRQRTVSTPPTLTGPTPPLTPTTPVLPPWEIQDPLLPRFEQSAIRGPRKESPPFSHPIYPYTHKAVARSGTSKATARTEKNARKKEKEFRQRRVRAAKLSKFFGVGYNDLEPHLVPEEQRSDYRKVEVLIDDRGALPWDRREIRSLEMEDVIVRLRDLRSS